MNSENPCAHGSAHIVDSTYYGHSYSTETSRRIFCDHCRIQRWLDVEAMLACCQAELGMIPSSVARHIVASARVEKLDLDFVRAQIRTTGHSLVGLLRAFQAACPQGAGEYVHYGATTQDIQDTGQALEMRDVLDALEESLGSILARLSEVAGAHSATPALGRTHAQPALPMAFGLKVASWIDEILRHVERVRAMRPRVLAAQLFGGVGTMAGFGEFGPDLLARFADRLGLATPATGWHVARDRVAEFVTTLAMVTATMARIAEEVRLLSRPEFGEVEEEWTYGKVGSSTMPHKRNPEACEQVSVMATLAAAQVGTVLTAMRGDHERDARTLRVEWVCVPDVSHYCLAACQMVDTISRRLKVRPNRLLSNVREVADQVATEKLMFLLGKSIGKQSAHERVYVLSQAARSTGQSLRELIRADAAISAVVAAEELDWIFDPVNYLGSSRMLTERVLSNVDAGVCP